MTFADLLDAFCAKMYLNDIELPRDKAKLSVEFKIQKCEQKFDHTPEVRIQPTRTKIVATDEEKKSEIPKPHS